MLETLLGLGIGLFLGVVMIIQPKWSGICQTTLVLATSSGWLNPMSFLVGMTILGGASALSLVPKWIGQKEIGAKSASKIINSIADVSLLINLITTLAAGVMVLGGISRAVNGLAKAIGVVSIPMAIIAMACKAKQMKGKRTAFILCGGLAAGVGLAFIHYTGSAMAMVVVCSILVAREGQKERARGKVCSERFSLPISTRVWEVIGMSTILIGIPSSLLNEITKDKKTSELQSLMEAGVIDIVAGHVSTLLFLMLGMARTSIADGLSKGLVGIEISPIYVCVCLGVIILVQWWVSDQLPAIAEWYQQWKAPQWGAQSGIVVSLVSCMMIGAPIGVGLLFIGAGLCIGWLAKRLEVQESLTTVFSTIPVIGIML